MSDQTRIRSVIHPMGALDGVQWRDSGDGTNMTVEGHAAVYNRVSELLGFWMPFYERIAPGAFDEVLASPDLDCRALVNHDPNLILGRSTAGTLDLQSDEAGLRFWAKAAPTTYAQDLRLNMQAGNVTQCSFAFMIGEEEQDFERDGVPGWTIQRVSDLLDVSVVTYPAYPDTDATARGAFLRDANRRYGVEAPEIAARPDGDEGTSSVAPADPAGEASQARERAIRLKQLDARARCLVVTYPPRAA